MSYSLPPARVPADRFAQSEAELARILNLPVLGEGSDALTRQVTSMMVTPEAQATGFSLLPKQAEAVAAYMSGDGSLFGPIGVGHGKTGITLMIAALASEFFRLQRVALVVPNKLCPQLLVNNIPWWRRRVRLNTTFWSLYKKSPVERRRIMLNPVPGAYVVPYSALSNRDASEMIESIDPDLWIFDEVHTLNNKDSATTERVFRHINPKERGAKRPKVVALSGTITDRSVKDYYHTMAACLGALGSVLPNNYQLLQQWDLVLGSERNSDQYAAYLTDQAMGCVSPMLTWARRTFPGVELPEGIPGIRRAYRLRMMTAPNVVCTMDDEIGVSLNLRVENKDEHKHPINENLQQKFRDLNAMKAPDGTELAHAMHKFLYNWELSAGVYYEHPWPDTATPEQIEAAEEHREALNEYRKVLRDWLKDRRRPGLDTPFLVGQSMLRNGASEVEDRLLFAWWERERYLKQFVEIKPLQVGVRVCDSKVRQVWDAVERLEDKRGGALIWYEHNEFGRWLFDYGRELHGDKVVYCPAGNKYDELILDPRLKSKYVIAGMNAHGEGKDLQYQHQGVFGQLPQTAKAAQQILGRMHRRGQEKDEVNMTLALRDTWEDAHLWNLLLDATYQSSTTPQKLKILAANWLGEVQQFPDSYLVERGLELSGVSEDERRVLADRFSFDAAA